MKVTSIREIVEVLAPTADPDMDIHSHVVSIKNHYRQPRRYYHTFEHPREENELRLASAAATAFIKQHVNELRSQNGLAPTNIAPLDAWQWLMGRELDRQNKVYPHRTTTTAY